MIVYEVKCSDKGEHGDITSFLGKILTGCSDTDEEKKIVFQKGEYHFYSDFCVKEHLYASNTDSDRFAEKRIAINIHRTRNLTIDGNGSLFFMHGKVVPVKVTESENITLKNFLWDFPSPNVLEMKVKSKSKFSAEYILPESMMWDIQGKKLHWYDKSPFTGEIYWEEYGNGESYCNVVHDTEKNSLFRQGLNVGPFHMALNIKKTGSNTVKINYLKPLSNMYKPGNTFEMCASRKRDCVGSFFGESKDIHVENVNVHFMSGFGWLTQMCENVSFISCDFTPKENSDRCCTSFADLIHVSGAKGKIHIENCNFSHPHDDPINIHGTYTRVKQMQGGNKLTLEYVHKQQNGFTQYHEGDKVVFYLRKNLKAVQNGKEFTVKSVVNPLCDGNSVKEMVVEFCEQLPDELSQCRQYVCENVTYTPEVYIGSCNFTLIPTRGILCTTRKKTVIENNVFDNLTMAAVFLSDDCNDWYESGAIRDMTIRNNKFYIRKSEHFSGNKGAILIEPIVAQKDNDSICVHKNIAIEDNEFFMEHENVVNAKFTENLTVRNNKISSLCGEKIKAFMFECCKNVNIENNIGSDLIDLTADSTK